MYLALARHLRLPLATFDGALVRACRKAGIPVLTQADRIAEPGEPYGAVIEPRRAVRGAATARPARVRR